MSTNDATSRRSLLAVLPGLAVLMAGAAARSAGTMPQANAKYQSAPKGKTQCSNCKYFIPSSTGGGPGKCKIVAGSISPNGWCSIYTAK